MIFIRTVNISCRVPHSFAFFANEWDGWPTQARFWLEWDVGDNGVDGKQPEGIKSPHNESWSPHTTKTALCGPPA
jgi:hypothetical protein